MSDRRVLGLVALGGAFGALARYSIGRAVPVEPGAFPFSTFAVNVLGALALGVLVGVLDRHDHPPLWCRPLLAIGVLGAFTTFSTFAVEVSRLVADARAGLALAYALATLLVGIGAAALGARVTVRRPT